MKKQLQPKLIVSVDNDKISVAITKPEYFNNSNMARVSREISRQRKIDIKMILREARLKQFEETKDGN